MHLALGCTLLFGLEHAVLTLVFYDGIIALADIHRFSEV